MSFINLGLWPLSCVPILLESPAAFWDLGQDCLWFLDGAMAKEMVGAGAAQGHRREKTGWSHHPFSRLPGVASSQLLSGRPDMVGVLSLSVGPSHRWFLTVSSDNSVM